MHSTRDQAEQFTDLHDVLKKTEDLTEIIKESDIYHRYHKRLKALRADPPIYERFKTFRQKNFLLEMEQGKDYYQSISSLYAEYNELLLERSVAEFLTAEQQMNRMLKHIYDQIGEASGVDLTYFE